MKEIDESAHLLVGGKSGGRSRNDQICEENNDAFAAIIATTTATAATTEYNQKRRWIIMLVVGFANVFINCIVTLQAPFYPREAEQKGATATEFGLVFGIFQIAMFISSPIHGTLLGRLNPKAVYIVGLFLTSICTMLFGFLDWVNDRSTFIGLSLLLRTVEGCGTSAFFAATFTIVAAEFPESVSSTFGMVQTGAGVGLIIGPSFGGILYNFGGFVLPFVTVGLVLFLISIVSCFTLPSTNPVDPAENSVEAQRDQCGFIDLLKIPAVALDAACILFASTSMGFLEATFEPHLRKNFGFSVLTTGMIFIIDGAAYAITSPIWGKLCDGGVPPKYITLAGTFMTFLGVVLVGPPPGIYHTTLWMICLGLVINGAGAGATLNSACSQASLDAFANGFPDNLATYGLVSSLWVAAYSLGNFVGPCIGGVLLDHFGFRGASLYVLLNQSFIAILLVLFMKKSDNKLTESILAATPGVSGGTVDLVHVRPYPINEADTF